MQIINSKRLLPPSNYSIYYTKIQGQCLITWNNVNNNDKTIKKIGYNIYRGISANGIFYKLNTSPILTNKYEDRTLGKNPNTIYWYKLSTIYQNDKDEWTEGKLSNAFVYQVNNTNRWFKKMNERNMWILKNTGQLFDLYTFKTEGNKCPKCYDATRGRSANSNCDVCFGTGIEGGYEPMFQLYLRQKPYQTSLDLNTEGLQYNNAPGAWTISSVQIKNRDILINPEGKIFEVMANNVNQVAGYLFHQELMLKEFQPTHPIYKMSRSNLVPDL